MLCSRRTPDVSGRFAQRCEAMAAPKENPPSTADAGWPATAASARSHRVRQPILSFSAKPSSIEPATWPS
ncbi:hypothetical protein D3C71_2004700 [compost metagenome]